MPIYIAKLPAIEEDLIRIGDFTSPPVAVRACL